MGRETGVVDGRRGGAGATRGEARGRGGGVETGPMGVGVGGGAGGAVIGAITPILSAGVAAATERASPIPTRMTRSGMDADRKTLLTAIPADAPIQVGAVVALSVRAPPTAIPADARTLAGADVPAIELIACD